MVNVQLIFMSFSYIDGILIGSLATLLVILHVTVTDPGTSSILGFPAVILRHMYDKTTARNFYSS